MHINKRQISLVVVFCMIFQLVLTGLPAMRGQVDASAAPVENLIINGGFEGAIVAPASGWQDGAPQGWGVWRAIEGQQKVSVTEEVYHTGKRAIEIKHNSSARTDVTNDKPFAPITPGKSYAMEAWIKTQDIVPVDASKGMYIRTQFCRADGSKVLDGPSIPYLRGTTDWTWYQKRIDVPEMSEITGLKVELFFETGTGTVWVDDVSLTPMKGITSLELQPKSLNLDLGQKAKLMSVTKPGGVQAAELIWSSSNAVVASVYNGEVTALDYGTATITAATSDGQLSAQSFVNVESEAMKKMYDTVREKWATKLIGGPGIDLGDPDLKANVDALVLRMTNPEKTGRWDQLRDTFSKNVDPNVLWEGVISKTQADSWRISWAFGIIRDLSLAYAMDGSAIQGNEQLKNDIIRALDWMNTYIYNANKKVSGNWWDWEIGSPQEIMNILTLLYKDLPQDLLDRYIAAIDQFVPNPKKRVANAAAVETGANLLDKALVVTLRGIVGKDASKVTLGRDVIAGEFLYTKSKDGLYEDGSLVQHTSIAYTGGYGAVLLGRMADLFYILTDSPWSITDPNAGNVYKWIKNNFEPLIYKGAMMDAVKGRSISRAADSDHISGRTLIMTLLRLAQSAPPDIALETKRMIKEWVASDTTFDSYYKGLSLYELNLLKQLEQERSIEVRGELVHTQMFAGMDRAVQLRKNFGLSIAMFSDRIAAFEYGNGENKKGWYTGIGMTTLYNNDLKQYSDNYWPTIDSYRLPGTTTDGSHMNPGEWVSYHNPKTWVGGTVLDGYYGSVGMAFSLSASTGSALQGKKSWFLFDDEMVAVGSDITNNASSMTETIVENRQLTEAGKNRLLVNGEEKSTDLRWHEKMSDVQWAHLQGNVEGSDIGYVFPSREAVVGKRESRTGAWREINNGGPSDPVTRNYLSLAIEHGNAPQADGYAYVLLPGKTPAETAAYADHPDIQVLTKTNKVHAVKETKQQATGINFWEAGAFNIVKSDQAASVMMKENGDELSISVADPTQKQGMIMMDLGKITVDVVTTDTNIQVVQTFPYTKLAVNTQGAAGMSRSITLKVDPNQTIDMEAMQPGVKVTEVIVMPSEATIESGKQVELAAAVKPDDAKNKQVVWSLRAASQDMAILQIVDGKAVVKGLKPGTVEVITASVDGGHQATAKIVIQAASNPVPSPDPKPNPTSASSGGTGSNDSAAKDRVQQILGKNVKVESTEEELKAGEVKVSISAFASSLDFSSDTVKKLMAWNQKAKLVINGKDMVVSIPVKKLADLAPDGVRVSTKPVAEATVASIKDQMEGLGDVLVNVADQLEIATTDLKPIGKVEQKWTIGTKANPKQLAGMRYDEARKAWVPVLMKFKVLESGVEATFHGLPGGTYVLVERNKTFSDLTRHWVMDDAHYLASKSIMQGRTADAFVPNAQITRGEMAALIVRILDLNEKAANLHSDASELKGKWYENDIIQVQTAGLMTGYEDGSFKPNQPITRQEIAVLIARMLSIMEPGWVADADASHVDAFADRQDIAAWSLKEVAAVVRSGFLQGDQQFKLNPTATATRAEVAVVIKRMLDQMMG